MSVPEDSARDGEIIRVQYDWVETEPSTGVIEAVAVALDRDPTTLDALYDYIDFDALDALFRSETTADEPGLSLSFDFADQHVTVHEHGGVVVRPSKQSP